MHITKPLTIYSFAFILLSVFTWTNVKAGPLEDLQPGHWYEVPNSKLQDFAVKPPTITQSHYDSMKGTMHIAGITAAWSGGAYDTTRDRLMIWGGGHGDYGGNELYAFDVGTMTWSHLTLPSTGPYNEVDELTDGRPASRHTYDSLEYIPPPVDLFIGRGAGYFPGVQRVATYWSFDPKTSVWKKLPSLGEITGRHSAYDPITGRHYVMGQYDLWTIDLHNNSIEGSTAWVQRGASHAFFPDHGTMEIDPTRQKMIRIGLNGSFIWDLASPAFDRSALTTTGATDIEGVAAPGLQYDSNADRIVAWKGGAEVYTLNMDTLVWTKVAPASTNTLVPKAQLQNGTFGRFRYIPSKNIFILMNHTDQNVLFYKHTADKSANQPITPAKPTVN